MFSPKSFPEQTDPSKRATRSWPEASDSPRAERRPRAGAGSVPNAVTEQMAQQPGPPKVTLYVLVLQFSTCDMTLRIVASRKIMHYGEEATVGVCSPSDARVEVDNSSDATRFRGIIAR